MDLAGQEPPRRRRGPQLERALLDAAWAEMVEHGCSDLTYEAVAARAGTSRTVVYRRWPTKRDLVLAALARQGEAQAPELPDTGTLRGDLLDLLHDVLARRVPVMVVLATFAGEVYRATGLTPDDLRDSWIGSRALLMDAVIERAVARGEVAPERVTPRTRALAMDLVRHDALMLRTVSDETVRSIVDEVVLPVLTGATPR